MSTALPTVLCSWARVVKRTLESSGCDSEPLLRQAGVDPRWLDDPNGRCPGAPVARLWRLSVQATGDSAFGIKAARHVMPTSFHALWHALSASQTLRDAFERLTRHFCIVTDVWCPQIVEQGDHLVILLNAAVSDGAALGPEPEQIDAAAASMVYMARALLGDRRISPERVELQRLAPQDQEAFARTFRCPVAFGAPANRVVWPLDLVQRPLDGANAELAQHHEALLARYLDGLNRDDTVTQVRACLIDLLPQGEPSQEDVAARLHCSVRTLQRRLASLNLTYTEVVDHTRRELALRHLADPRCSVSEIAYLLGFADTSNFTRAFKRWTGRSPTEHRRASGSPGQTSPDH